MKSFATVEQAQEWFSSSIEDLDFCDNFRQAFVDDAEQVELYEQQRSEGCCGYVDDEVIVDGRKFWIGCNYGH